MRRATPLPAARPAALAALALLSLAAWLAWPRPAPAPPRAALRAVLLDASAGTTRLRPGWSRWARRALAEEARAARAEGQELLVVRYAAGVERLFGPGDPEEWLARLEGRVGPPPRLRLEGAAEQGTQLAAALDLAAGELLAAGRAAGELALVGEPSFTGADPGPRLTELARAGLGARLERPPPPELANLALVDLELPRAPAAGAPLALRASLALTPGSQPLAELLEASELTLELELRRPSGLERRALPLAPPALGPGGATWSVAIDLGPGEPGWTEVRARARLVGPGALRAGDPLPEDDRRSAATRVEGTRVGLALAAPERRAELAAWLAQGDWPGLDWVLLEPDDAPQRLGGADLVLTYDLPLGELPEAWLIDFVERRGGGLLVSGGWGLLRQWTGSAADPPLARLLPLVPALEEGEEREVLFLVDGSGSMVGEPFERVQRALVEMAEVAPPGDDLILRFFTGTLHGPIRLSGETPAERRRGLARLLGARPPGGGTAILYSLEELVRQRAGNGRPGLAILLSDGLDHGAHTVPERAAAIRRALGAGGMHLSVIAAGEQADLQLLAELAGEPGALHQAGDLADLAEIFQREVNRARVREGFLAVHPLDPASTALAPAREVLEALARLPDGALPPLERYARARLATGAAALLVSEQGEPVLAVQRVGAGLVAALGTLPSADWAPAWRGAQGVLGSVARALAAGPHEPEPRVELVAGRLELEGLPPGWPPRLAARLEDDRGALVALRELSLPVGRPGEDPRLRRTDPGPALADLPWGQTLRVVLADGGIELASLPLVLPLAEEWAQKRPLGSLPSPADPSARREEGEGAVGDPRHVWPLAAGLLALFLAGLAWVSRSRAGRPMDGAGEGTPPGRL